MQNIFIQYRAFQVLLSVLTIYLLVLLMAIIPTKTYAQQIESQVINSFGSSVLIDAKTFDISIGELAITTLSANGFAITQGFLQPIDLKLPCGDVVLRAFPNPVIKGMRIYAEGCDIDVASIKTYDLFGKLVYEGKPINNQVNFSSIGVGVYLVRAYNQHNQVMGVVKIIKTTI